MTISEGSPRRLTLSGRARDVHFGDETLVVDLEDGRQIAVPLAWFPRLAAATPEQRSNWEFVGRGIGISWPDVDEDVSVENLLGADGAILAYRDGRVPPTDGRRGRRRRAERVTAAEASAAAAMLSGKPANPRAYGRQIAEPRVTNPNPSHQAEQPSATTPPPTS